MGGTQRLPRLIGITKAKEQIFLGNLIRADEAYRLGLLNLVVEPNQLEAETNQFSQELIRRPSFGLQVIKNVMNTGMNTTLKEGLEIERQGLLFFFNGR